MELERTRSVLHDNNLCGSLSARQRVASDPRVQAYLQTWRSLLPGSIEIDVYQEAG